MRIYQTKFCMFMSDSQKELKDHIAAHSKFMERTFQYKITQGKEAGAWRYVEWHEEFDEGLLQQDQQRILKATRSFMAKEIPLSKYKLEYDLDLKIDNAKVVYYRIKKGIHYMILAKMKTKLRVAYKGVPDGGKIIMESISGYEFMEANKIRGVDFNFIRATRTVPVLIHTRTNKVISMKKNKSWNINKEVKHLVVKRGYESKLTQLLMEQSLTIEEPDMSWF